MLDCSLVSMALPESVTEWLQLWRAGDDLAIERVTAMVYRDLRRMAAYYLSGESNANTLQPTALVHEAYLHISAIRDLEWKDRSQFIGVVARMMRRILVDHARNRNAAKRDAKQADTPQPGALSPSPLDVLAVDEALTQMAASYPRCCEIVELRFFGDLEFPEIAEALDLSLSTVERDWRFARAWLQNRMARP
jgi:RNA polymerase sigma-70 factor (ECF subfamily)